MNEYPLVSIMIPAYNAEKTILMALGSLLNQTYSNWQCIVVDDGSTDNTAVIVNSISDKRIKLIKLAVNMGRGYARQVALEHCDGEYIAMLDADDWYYDYKLEIQVNALKKYPEVSIVSCGMAITNSKGQINGVRAIGDNCIKVFSKPTKVPVPHAPTMFKKSLTNDISYDYKFKLAQDVDFLRRLMLHEKYIMLDKVGYVYEEHGSNNLKKNIQSYCYSSLGYLKFIKNYPFLSIYNSSLENLKIVRVCYFSLIGKYNKLLESRSAEPNTSQKQMFNKQLEKASLSEQLIQQYVNL